MRNSLPPSGDGSPRQRSSGKGPQRLLALAGAVVLAFFVLFAQTALSAQPHAVTFLQLGVPAYVYPGQQPLLTLQSTSPPPGIVILDPGNGDAPFTSPWQSQADQLRAAGTTVLGYVHTDDATRPEADVQVSVRNYFRSTTGSPHVNGIFFDEMSTSCTDEAYYHRLYIYVRKLDPGAFVAENPGTPVNACDLRSGSVVASTFVTFEHDSATYISDYQGNVVSNTGTYSDGSQYPAATFWHLVYGVASSDMNQVVSLAASRHAGYVYATDGDLPNPWDSVASYIAAEAQDAAATASQ